MIVISHDHYHQSSWSTIVVIISHHRDFEPSTLSAIINHLLSVTIINRNHHNLPSSSSIISHHYHCHRWPLSSAISHHRYRLHRDHRLHQYHNLHRLKSSSVIVIINRTTSWTLLLLARGRLFCDCGPPGWRSFAYLEFKNAPGGLQLLLCSGWNLDYEVAGCWIKWPNQLCECLRSPLFIK